MTIKDLIRDQPCLRQMDILMRADRLFSDGVGRFYGGQLSEEQVQHLVPPEKEPRR